MNPTYVTNVDLSIVDGELVADASNSSTAFINAVSFINNPLASVTAVSFLSGPTGPQGATGPAGTTDYTQLINKPTIVNDKTYTYPFTTQSFVTVTHNLGKYPSVQVIDSAGDQCEGDVIHLSTNQLTVSFGTASFSGTVICN